MSHAGYCLFDTPLGWCGIAWRQGGPSAGTPAVTLLQLPEATAEKTASRMARASGAPGPSAPPTPIAGIIERLRRHLGGEAQDLRDIVVDLTGADAFARQVYEAARAIPPGQTRTYGEIASAVMNDNGTAWKALPDAAHVIWKPYQCGFAGRRSLCQSACQQ